MRKPVWFSSPCECYQRSESKLLMTFCIENWVENEEIIFMFGLR